MNYTEKIKQLGPKGLREQLWSNDYRPVMIPHGKKHPVEQAWQLQARENPPRCISTGPNPRYPGTGILCDRLRPIDIDIIDGETVKLICDWCFENIGEAPIRLRADSEKILLLYRAEPTDDPLGFHKEWFSSGDMRIEILGAGNQFFAYGRHPDGCDLHWVGGPHETAFAQLNIMSEEQVQKLLLWVFDQEYEQSLQDVSEPPNKSTIQHQNLTLNEIAECLNAIPNNNPDYHWWTEIGMAVFINNNSVDAFNLWRNWTAQHYAKDVDKNCKRLWKSLQRDAVKKITCGRLVWEAKQANHDFHLKSRHQVVMIKPRYLDILKKK